MFGVLIVTTDPVSVLATFKETGVGDDCGCWWRRRACSTTASRDTIVIAPFSVVAFSVIVQGIAMPLWLRHWGLLPNGPE